MSSVETGQMSAVETGQMFAAETGQMSAVPESSGSAWACGTSQVAPAGIWLGRGVRGGGRQCHAEGGRGRPAPPFFDVFRGLKIDAKMVHKK